MQTSGASCGVLVAVVQWGRGSPALGVSEKIPIESYVPMMMFAIVFGLSLDYEVFLLSTNVVVKMLALGLGVSVLIDATVIRLVVVPATMFLLGRYNWWIPRWLDRALPHLEPEGPPARPLPRASYRPHQPHQPQKCGRSSTPSS